MGEGSRVTVRYLRDVWCDECEVTTEPCQHQLDRLAALEAVRTAADALCRSSERLDTVAHEIKLTDAYPGLLGLLTNHIDAIVAYRAAVAALDGREVGA
jgi:hypothetical protein